MMLESLKELVRKENCFYFHPNMPGVLFFEKWLPQLKIGRTFAWLIEENCVCVLFHPKVAKYSKLLSSDAWGCGDAIPAPIIQIAYTTEWSLYPDDGGITIRSLAEGADDQITANIGVLTALQGNNDMPSEFLNILREKGMVIPTDHPEMAMAMAKKYNIPVVECDPNELQSGFVGSENQISNHQETLEVSEGIMEGETQC